MNNINSLLNIFFLILLVQAFIPLISQKIKEGKRLQLIKTFEDKRGSRVITMIHRQETISFLGIPISRYIDIEDSEKVIRAIRLTDSKIPIDMVLHTPGGLVLAAEQIAYALKHHRAKVTVYVPHYAMSGGTLLALSADNIVMDHDAVLGPVDPQLGSPQQGSFPAASILKALETPNKNRDDNTLILGDVARKAINQVHEAVYYLLKDKMPEKKAEKISEELSRGKWTHDYAITYGEAKEMGLPVSKKMPKIIYKIMDLYQQPRQRQSNVEYIPLPYRSKKDKINIKYR
jgi:ClpP class serine protease